MPTNKDEIVSKEDISGWIAHFTNPKFRQRLLKEVGGKRRMGDINAAYHRVYVETLQTEVSARYKEWREGLTAKVDIEVAHREYGRIIREAKYGPDAG